MAPPIRTKLYLVALNLTGVLTIYHPIPCQHPDLMMQLSDEVIYDILSKSILHKTVCYFSPPNFTIECQMWGIDLFLTSITLIEGDIPYTMGKLKSDYGYELKLWAYIDIPVYVDMPITHEYLLELTAYNFLNHYTKELDYHQKLNCEILLANALLTETQLIS